MVRKNNLVILGLVLFTLIFSSCSALTGGESKSSGLSIGGGSASSSGGGVVLEFGAVNIEPQKGYAFPIPITITNFQKHAVSDLVIRPTGFDTGYVSGLQSEYRESLSAATDNGPYQKSLYISSVTVNGFTGNYDFNPVFKYCYSATTVFNEQVCVPDKYGKCDIKSSGVTQNGPISVKVDRIIPVGENEISVEFSLSDSLGGNVVNDCFQDSLKMDFGNKYSIAEVKLGSTVGQCIAAMADDYTINQGKGRMVCMFARGQNQDPYSSQINVKLNYKYQQQVQKKLTVRDLTVR